MGKAGWKTPLSGVKHQEISDFSRGLLGIVPDFLTSEKPMLLINPHYMGYQTKDRELSTWN